MAAPDTPESLRVREARESALRKRRLSIRLGGSGILVLFFGGIGTGFYPGYVNVLLVVMVAGFVLVLLAFLVIRTVAASGSALRLRDLLKEP